MAKLVDGIYYSDEGYITVDTPKNSKSFDWVSKRNVTNEKFSFEALRESEKEYNKLVAAINKLNLSGVININQVKPQDRVAIIYFTCKDVDYYLNNVMTFHLQKGVVFNLPLNRMRKVVNSRLTLLSFDELNNGAKVKDAVRIIKNFMKQMEKQCSKVNVSFNDDIKLLSLLGLSGKFVYDVKIWEEYLSYGLNPFEVSFGLSKELNPDWESGKLSVTPEIASGLIDVPSEWVRNLLLD
jgi:hypothetical protein